MKSGWASYWLHWLLLTGGILLFLGVAPILPTSWERIELPVIQDENPALVQAHKTAVEVRIPPPLRPRNTSSQVLSTGTSQATSDTSGTSERILLVGDSMIEWVRFRLASWCKEAGYTLHTVIWPSSGLVWWGSCDTLRAFIERYKPTYLLISLGSNELFVPAIEKRRPKLNRILSQAGDIPVVWIGPPAWKKDEGIIDFLRQSLGPGRYISSERLTMERYADGAHPTRSEAYRWADTIVAYLRDSALYPLHFPRTPPKRLTASVETIFLEQHAP